MNYKVIIPVNQHYSEIEKILESLYPLLNISENGVVIRKDDITYRKSSHTYTCNSLACSIPISIEYGDSHIDGYEITQYLTVNTLLTNPLNSNIKYIPCTEISIDGKNPEMIRLLRSYVQKVGGWFVVDDIVEFFLNETSYCLSEDRIRYNIEAYRIRLRELTQSFWPSYTESSIERIIEEFYTHLEGEQILLKTLYNKD